MSRGPNQAGEIYVAIKGDATDLNRAIDEANRRAQEQNQRQQPPGGGVPGVPGTPGGVPGTPGYPGGPGVPGIAPDASVVGTAGAVGSIGAAAAASFSLGKAIGDIVFSMAKFEASMKTLADLMEQQNAYSSQILDRLSERAKGSTVEGFGEQLSSQIADAESRETAAQKGIANRSVATRLRNWLISLYKKTPNGMLWDNAMRSGDAVGYDLPDLSTDTDGLDAELGESQDLLRQLRKRQDVLRMRTNEQTLNGIGEKYGIDTGGVSFGSLTDGERAAITFGGANGNASEIVSTLVEIRKINEAMEQSLRRLNTAPLNVVTKPERDQGDNK